MQVTELSQSGLRREFKVVIPAADIAIRVATRLSEIGREAKLPGFRPGKIPLPVLKRHYGQAVMGEVLEKTVQDCTSRAMTERGLRPALQPKVEVTAFAEGADLEYKLAIETLPEFMPTDLRALAIERIKVALGDDEIDKALARVARQSEAAERKTDRAAATGDVVVIDFDGSLDGERFEGGAAQDFKLELGSGRFVPGFEDKLVGVKAAEARVVEVTFPATYGNDQLAGRAAKFEVTVKEVRERIDLPADETLAKTMGFDDLPSLRKAVADQLGREYGDLARLRTKRQVFDALAAVHDFPVPQGMVDIELQGILQNLERERQAGVAEVPAGATVEEIRGEYGPIAERRVRLGLLLSEVGRLNNIQVSQEEINRAIVEQARRYPGQEKKVVEFYRNTPEALAQLRGPLFEDKVVDFILEMAKVTDRPVGGEELMRLGAADDKPAEGKAAG